MIEKREKRKKIFYVPGMISLVFIPLFCFYHFYKVDAFKVYGSIGLGMPNQGDFVKYKVETLRKYKVYKFKGNEFDDKKTLNQMTFYLRKLISDKDTVNGVKLQYNTKTSYDVFIRTLDILAIENAPTWGIFGNDVYIIASNRSFKKAKQDSVNHTMNCGTGAIMAQQAYWEQKQRKEEEKHNFGISFFKQKWISLSLGYFGLVLLNIFVLVKFHKNKQILPF
ncbi:hypothetical protein AR687_11400 [Flavobacteriaceae bacterium CRH]|nr:hypothetical protein AR687_11400 [Flavobacteriaceae bacterium CRH]